MLIRTNILSTNKMHFRIVQDESQLVGFSVPRLGTEAMYIFKTENNTRGTSSVGKTGHLQCKGSGFSPRSGN